MLQLDRQMQQMRVCRWKILRRRLS
jgi:hypothetical protein